VDIVKTLTQPFSDISVYAIQADAAACGHYRVVYPMEFLRRGGARVTIGSVIGLRELEPYDIVMAQRQHAPNILQLLKEARYMGKTLVYEIDDNVHRVHPNSPAFSAYRPGGEAVHGVQKFMEQCDGLFTSSAELASQYAGFNKRTWVLQNCIDFGLRDWETPVERHPDLKDKLVIGWAGSITHQDDWAPLKGVIGPILKKYPHTMFCIVSAYQTMDIFLEKLDLPADRVVRLEPVDFAEYPKLPAQFDIGLVPVVNTDFNRAKSDLKPLEYGARHVPYVASKLAPYVRLHQETGGQGGYIADNQEQWITAISRLVEDDADRKSKAEFMFDYAKNQRSGANNAWRWAEAFRDVKAARTYQPLLEQKYVVNEKPGRNSPCNCGSGTKYKKCCYPAWG
jgi:uncharacterized protein YchJ